MNRLRVAGAFLALMCSVGLTACGEELPTVGQFEPRYLPSSEVESGGTLRVMASSDFDSLDPGSTNSQFGLMLAQATQRTPYEMAPDETGGLIPNLATGAPVIDRHAGKVEFKLRSGVRYSPPVDREVVAADIEYAVERSLLPGVSNGYVDAYLGNLVGFRAAKAEALREPNVAPDIRGISTPDRRTVRLQFRGQVPPVAIEALALPLGAPVPESYAAPLDAEVPSAYGRYVVTTGPYMVANDSTGRLTGRRPGIRTDLVRNPNWSEPPGGEVAFLDQIHIEHGYSNTSAASRRIVNGDAMVSGDFLPDPATLADAATEHPDQLVMVPARASLYASLNTTIPPLDDPDVRRAIVAATDRSAMRLVRGGEIIGPLATHFIPPGVAGFEDAGGLGGPGFDFLESPSGDPELAGRYMEKAGYEGGQYRGEADLELVTDTTGVGRRVGELVRNAVESLGITVRTQAVARDVMYSRYCNVSPGGDCDLSRGRLAQPARRSPDNAPGDLRRSVDKTGEQLQLAPASGSRHRPPDEPREMDLGPRSQGAGLGPDRS